MTAPEVFQVRDGDGWEVYVTNPAGGWWLLGSVGGTAVVDTLPDGAEAMVAVPRTGVAVPPTTCQCGGDIEWLFEPDGRWHGSCHGQCGAWPVVDPVEFAEGGDRRG